MAKQTTATPSSAEASTALAAGTGPPSLQAAAFMAGRRETVKAIQAIGEQVLIDQTLQAGILWKALHAQEQETELTVQTLQHYQEYQQGRQGILDQPREAPLQKELEAFAQVLDKTMRETLVATRMGAVNAIHAIVVKPITTPSGEGEIVITEEPNGIAKFFGAPTKTTRVVR